MKDLHIFLVASARPVSKLQASWGPRRLHIALRAGYYKVFKTIQETSTSWDVLHTLDTRSRPHYMKVSKNFSIMYINTSIGLTMITFRAFSKLLLVWLGMNWGLIFQAVMVFWMVTAIVYNNLLSTRWFDAQCLIFTQVSASTVQIALRIPRNGQSKWK